MATAADRAMEYYLLVQQKGEEKSARKQKQTFCAIDLESVEHRFPSFSQIYKGNQSEPETLEEILKRLYVEDETLFKETLPTIVMDRGIARYFVGCESSRASGANQRTLPLHGPILRYIA
ncbi:MAG: hypothetical protein WA118_02310 [Carboxydocellales bacterium]